MSQIEPKAEQLRRYLNMLCDFSFRLTNCYPSRLCGFYRTPLRFSFTLVK